MKLAEFPQNRSRCPLSYAKFCIILVSVFLVIKDIGDGSITPVHRVLVIAVLGPSYQCASSGGEETTSPSHRMAPN